MTFTDDELKWLKEIIKACEGNEYGVDLKTLKVKALVARLEAAEACIDDHRGDCLADVGQDCSCGYSNKLDRWRKVAGK